jgi:ribosomal protein S18 acetylase RimI-like enzyme
MPDPSCTTYYLEMHSPDQLRPKPQPEDLHIVECRIKQFRFNRFLYQLVGEPWQWTEKLAWSDAQWRALVEQAEHRTWVAYHQGAIAGYYELLRSADGAVEILYFGLVADFFGRGFGGPLLTHALQAAWAWPGTERVWVHTCTLDHPSALANYRARGLQLYREEVTEISS